MDLPKNEEELQLLINQKLEEQKATYESKINEAAANARKEEAKKLEKYKQQQALTEEERAKALAKEKEDELNAELTELRAYKKKSTLEARLEKEGLPKYLANDNRLISANDEQFEKVLKEVKKDYEGNLPKGSQHSNVVPMQVGNNQAQPNAKEQAYAAAAETLKDLF